jgi:hypothetical protein
LTIHDFAADIRLIWENAEKFNGKDHPVAESGKALDIIFTKKLGEFLSKKREAGTKQ